MKIIYILLFKINLISTNIGNFQGPLLNKKISEVKKLYDNYINFFLFLLIY